MAAPALPTFAVLGQGSIGRRHAGLLAEAGVPVVVFDPVAEVQPAEGIRIAAGEEEAIEAADAVVVASPTSEHLAQAARVVAAGRHALVEKPLAVSADGTEELVAEAERRGLALAVAMNLRFHPGPAGVRAAIAAGDIGRPLMAEVTFGSYLPDWRPQVDYRRSYSARSELGGGVLLDVVHELDYVTWALGEVADVSAWIGRVSALEIDVEDLAMLQLGHVSGAVSSLTLDYLDRAYRRGCRVVGEDATVTWDWHGGEVAVLRPGGEADVRPAPADPQAAYRAQTRAFVEAVREGGVLDGSGLVPARDGAAALRVIDAARASSAEGRRVRL